MLPGYFYTDALSVRDDLQLPQWIGNVSHFVAERRYSEPNGGRRHTVLAQLGQSSKSDQIGKRELLQVLDQVVALPAAQLAFRYGKKAQNFLSRIDILRSELGHRRNFNTQLLILIPPMHYVQ